nr:MAG TPA: hypothetical protein [Caudoviricetes sp.]
MKYNAEYVCAAVEAAKRMHANTPFRIDVGLSGDTDEGLVFSIEDDHTGNKITVPLDGLLHDRVNAAEVAVSYLLGKTSVIPEGASLLRPVRWWDVYTADEKDLVRIAIQNAAKAEKKLQAVCPVPVHAQLDGSAVVRTGDDTVVLPANLVDRCVVNDAYQWLIRDDRRYETTENVPYAPKHYRQGVFCGVPRLQL